MKFLVNEQNVSVMYIDINALSLYLDLNIFQQDECFCSKLAMEVEYTKSNLKASLSQIWVTWQLLPFVRVGQKWDDWLDDSWTTNVSLYFVIVSTHRRETDRLDQQNAIINYFLLKEMLLTRVSLT